MKVVVYFFIGILIVVVGGLAFILLIEQDNFPEEEPIITTPLVSSGGTPAIASWLAKKDEIIQSGKPFDLIMTGWVTPEEASKLKSQNSKVIILAGLTTNFVYDGEEWMTFLSNVANYNKKSPIQITEEMYLKDGSGKRCAFGWKSDEFSTEEIYAMDPRNKQWSELVISFYKQVLEQPQHNGIIVDMVTDWSPCPETISNSEWISATKNILSEIKKINEENKLIIFNSGKDLSEIVVYEGFFDGYLMENSLGEWGVAFEEGLQNGKNEYIVIYNVDTDDTGAIDDKRMRLGLTLSLLNDNTYFAYDFGSRDHGQAWWYEEYDANLGKPLGAYYEKDGAYFREFENAVVVSSPDLDVIINFEQEYKDITSEITSRAFTIDKGDGRIFIK